MKTETSENDLEPLIMRHLASADGFAMDETGEKLPRGQIRIL